MEKTEPGYKELKEHIKLQVKKMTKAENKKELVRGNFWQGFVGALMLLGFSYWTFKIVTAETSAEFYSNWWLILTIWGAFMAIGFLSSAFSSSSQNENLDVAKRLVEAKINKEKRKK